MERSKALVERDVRKFNANSESIEENVKYLREFYSKEESWEVCMSILNKHTTSTHKMTKSTSDMLVYCAITLKRNAYEGFKFQMGEGINKYRKLWEICEKVMELMFIYSETHEEIASQLASVVACAVIYGFETTHSPSELLFLIALSKTKEGTLGQYLYLSNVAREAMGKNISIHLNHRCGFLRMCIGMAPKVFSKLVTQGMKGDVADDHQRIGAITDWLQIHVYVLKLFYPVILEEKFLESCELVFEETMAPTRKVSDLFLVQKSLSLLVKFGVVEMITKFIKFGIGTEDERIMQASTELGLYLLYMCQVDLAGLLMLASNKYQEMQDNQHEDKWKEAGMQVLENFSPTISEFTSEFVCGMCEIGWSLYSCGEKERSLGFLKEETSKWLVDLCIGMAHEHLPFALHFGLVDSKEVYKLAKFINLYLNSSDYRFRKEALEFWKAFQSHLCPRRRDLSYVNASSIENMRLRTRNAIRPLFELFVKELYESIIIREKEDLENFNGYREGVVRSLREASMVTGTDYVLSLVRRDLESLLKDFRVQVLERLIFVTSVMAKRVKGPNEIVKSVVLIALDVVDFNQIEKEQKQPVNFYKNTVYRLLMWTSDLISKDEDLLCKTVRMMGGQMRANKASKMVLDSHVLMDQCILALTFSIASNDPWRKMLIEHLTFSVTNYAFPVDKRLEILEGFMNLVETLPREEQKEIRLNILKGLFYQVCHVSELREAPESYLFLLGAMSSINFRHQEDMDLELEVGGYVVEFITRFTESEELWRAVADVMFYVNFRDQSSTKFSENTIMNNKTSFLYWLFENANADFYQLSLAKTVFKNNLVKKRTKLYEVMLKYIVKVCVKYMEMIKSNSPPAEHSQIDLLDCLSMILTRTELVHSLLEWKEVGEFVSVLCSILPARLGNLNLSAFSVIAKYVAWAEIPKQLVIKVDPSTYQKYKDSKKNVRLPINKREEDSEFSKLAYGIIDAIFRGLVAGGDQMEGWTVFASQALSVLIKCTQTAENARMSLKNVMKDRCSEMTTKQVNFYFSKLIRARGSKDILYLLRIISDYHSCKFTLY